MKSHLCPRSHAQESFAAAGSVLCAACVEEVGHFLRVLPGLHRECLHRVSVTGRGTNPTRVSGSRSRDRLDISVLEARYNILAVLESWSAMVVEKRGAAVVGPRTVSSLARFLALHLRWLSGQPAAVDFADEIEALVGELRRTIDPEPDDLRTLIRQCVVDGCPGTISVAARRPAGAGSSIACSFGHSWPVCEWLGLRRLMERQRKGVGA